MTPTIDLTVSQATQLAKVLNMSNRLVACIEHADSMYKSLRGKTAIKDPILKIVLSSQLQLIAVFKDAAIKGLAETICSVHARDIITEACLPT